jgi:hypothetical protein
MRIRVTADHTIANKYKVEKGTEAQVIWLSRVIFPHGVIKGITKGEIPIFDFDILKKMQFETI